MKNLENKVAVVTGAASGIGRATSIALATEGCLLAISDVDEAGLEETGRFLKDMGVEVHAQLLDVSDRDAFFAYAQDVFDAFGRVNLVINNAGVIVRGSLQETTDEEFKWIMGINFWGMVYGSMAFLPFLKQSGEGHICNVSSMFGYMAPLNVGSYASSKFAIRAFSESLRTELDVEECGVGVTTIHPGMIKTDIMRKGRIKKSLAEAQGKTEEEMTADFAEAAFNTPEKVAQVIVKGVKRDKLRVMVGFDAYFVDWATRLFPVLFRKLAVFILKRDKAKQLRAAS